MVAMKKQKTPWQQAKAALKDLEAMTGNRGQIAIALGLTRTTAYAWRVIPKEHLKKACQVFEKTPQQLRPDLTEFQIKQLMKVWESV